uniref:Guanylate cyclase n=1 Tax=Lepisosteus oculatus TaxID=7918 RepID=W5M3H3_LEPOC
MDFKLLISMPNTSSQFHVGRIGAGALIAIDEINRNSILLKVYLLGHRLVYEYVDDECDAIRGPGKIVSLQHNQNYSAFIGPSCSKVCSHVGRLAGYWNIAVVSPICADSEFLDKKEFPTMTRVFGPFTKMGSFFVKICEKFNWRRIGIIYDTSPTWTIPAGGIRLYYTVQGLVNSDTGSFHHFSSIGQRAMRNEIELSHQLSVKHINIRHNSSLLAKCMQIKYLNDILINAHNQGLINGEYVFFCFEPYEQKQRCKAGGGAVSGCKLQRRDAYDSIAREAYQALFLLTLYKPDNERYMNFSAEVIRRSKEDFGYQYEPGEKVSVLPAIAHDSVWLYAHALNETISENGDPYNGTAISRKMWNRTITGIQGEVTIDDNGDRESSYMMYHVQNKSNGTFQVIANYFGTRKNYEQVPGLSIVWPGGRSTPPLDTPVCGFTEEMCEDDSKARTTIIAVGLIGGLLAVVIVGLSLLYRKYKLQEKASLMLWKVNFSEVSMMETKHNSSVYKKLEIFLRGYTYKAISESENTQSDFLFTKAAMYKENICSIRFLHVKSINLNNELINELRQCRDLNHPNVCSFIGACLESPHHCLLTEYCPKGSLQDILKNDSIKLDWMFKYSLMLDIVKGMDYIHKSYLRSHGHLSSSNCVVDSRFVLKITDFGLSNLRRPNTAGIQNSKEHWQCLLWRAPELLRGNMPTNGTQKGDVYSFGIIAQEIVYRNGVFFIPSCVLKANEIIEKVKEGGSNSFRPYTDTTECPGPLAMLMKSCWRERPSERPDFTSLKATVKKLDRGSDNILDNLLSRMEQYASNLEDIVNERTAQLLEEKKKAESLLTQMLPRSVAIQLISGKTVQAETYDCVTIYFSDIVGFTAMSAGITPMQVVDLLNDLYTYFDNIIDNHDVYKVETIGDAYMVVSGLPIRNGDEHAKEIARMSLSIVDAMKKFENRHVPGQQLKVRIGLHSGPCVAGVVGLKMPRYCLFGDTVNTASRMESYGLPLKVHVSSSAKDLLDKFRTFRFELRGDIHMKGKGLVRTFWLLGEETKRHWNDI